MNGQEALNILMIQDEMTSMHRNKFDLIFLDLHMPILDGFQAVEQIRLLQKNKVLNLKTTKIIALSAISEKDF